MTQITVTIPSGRLTVLPNSYSIQSIYQCGQGKKKRDHITSGRVAEQISQNDGFTPTHRKPVPPLPKGQAQMGDKDLDGDLKIVIISISR